MNSSFSYKDDDQPCSTKNSNMISIVDHSFKYSELDDEIFTQCIFDFENLMNFQNINENQHLYMQSLNYINIYIKRNPDICTAFNDSNYFQRIENFLLSQESLSIDNEIISQIIDICSTSISFDYPITIFPLRLVSIILSFIQIDKNHDILKSSLFFVFFLQNYRSNVQDQNYLSELNTLIDQSSLQNNILEIEKILWLHILHHMDYQNISIDQAIDLLYTVYTTISSFFLLKNIKFTHDPSILHKFHQEIHFRIFEALKFILSNLEDNGSEEINDFNEADYFSIVQSILYILLNFISYDEDFIVNSSSLSFSPILLEMIRIDSLSTNNDLILQIINRIISINDEYFFHQDLFQTFQFLLETSLCPKDEESNENDENFPEIQNEKIVTLIYEILSKIIRSQFNFQSKSIFIQTEKTPNLIEENDIFLIPSCFVILAIKMMKDTSYSIKISMIDFISSLIIFGGNAVINEIVTKFDENNLIIQLFYDFLIYCNQTVSDQNDDDWRIKQMKLSLKLILDYFSSKEVEYSRPNCLLNDLFEYIYSDAELFDLDSDFGLITPNIHI